MMNRIYRLVWNATQQAWIVAGEFSGACKKTKTVGTLLVIGCATISPLTQAACTNSSGATVATGAATAGSTLTCSGTTAGQYDINTPNVTLTNTGTLTGAGLLTYGLLYVSSTNGSGANIVNQGQAIWTDAQFGGGGTGTRAAFNVGAIYDNNWTSASFLNDTNGAITIDVSTLGASRTIAAVSASARQGSASVTNKGSITITSASTTASSSIAGMVGIGKNVQIYNSGTINLIASAGAATYGLLINTNILNGTGLIENSGSVVLSTSGNAYAVTLGNITSAPTSLTINNSGILAVTGGRSQAVIYLSAEVGSTPIVVNNTSTGVMQADDGAYSINFASAVARPVQITNAGTIVGAIRTRAGDDSYVQTSGSLKGSMNLGDGNNTVALSGGTITGNIITGTGDDTLSISGGSLSGSIFTGAGTDVVNLSGSADVSNTLQIDGGTGSTTVNIDGLAVKGFTGANDITNGINLTNIETINLGSGTDFTLLGNLFETAATDHTLNIASDATLEAGSGTGLYTIYGDVNNSGKVSLQDSTAGNQLTVTGDWTGSAGTVLLNTVLGGDDSLTDKLVISGSATGTTYVKVNNENGTGAQTLEGIEVISTGSSTSDAFVQSGRIVAGVYDYHLQQGTTSGSNMNNWYLTSSVTDAGSTTGYTPTLRPEIASYTANLAAANTLFNTRLHDRLGETRYTDVLTGEQKVTSLWLRSQGGRNSATMSDGQNKTTANRYVFQMGGDVAQGSTDGVNRLHLGVMGGYGNQHSSTHNSLTGYGSKGTLEGYSTGVYGTWFQNEVEKTGLYVDSWAQYNWFDNTVKGDGLSEEKYKSRGVTASVESGYTLHTGSYTTAQGMKNDFYLEPQVQLTWSGVKADDHTESNGTHVQGAGNGNLQTRVGTRLYMKGRSALDRETQREFEPFVEVNWIYNSQQYGTRMNGVSDSLRGTRNIGELKTGVEAKLSDNVNLWGSVGQQMGGSGYHDTQGVVGIKALF